MAGKKHVDPLKAKQKRQKIIAAVLGVLFVGVLAFQVPRVMKMMKTPPNPHANDSITTTTATGTPSLAAPTLGGAEQPATTDPTTGAPVAVSATPTVAGRPARLVQPFREQGSLQPAAQRRQGLFAVVVELGRRFRSGSGSAGSGGTSSPPQIPGGSTPQPGSAVISVNGTLYTVATAATSRRRTRSSISSPSRLTRRRSRSPAARTPRVPPTVTLRENKPVTLVNTADGTRYTLILKPLGTGVPGGSTSSRAGSGTSSSGSGSSGSGTTTTNPVVDDGHASVPLSPGLRSGRGIERGGDARVCAREVGRVPDDDRHRSELVAVARRVEVEVRVDAIRLMVRARRRIARVASVRGGHSPGSS